jgi:hypothetical protein
MTELQDLLEKNRVWSGGSRPKIRNFFDALAKHGIKDGLLRDLDICITNQNELEAVYERAPSASV